MFDVKTDYTSVLMSGVSGFLGNNLINYLSDLDIFEITGISRDPARLRKLVDNKVLSNTIQIDQLSEYNDEDFTHYVHLAGKVHDSKNLSDEDVYYEANFKLTKCLFDHFKSSKRSKIFIFVSTIHVLTENPIREITEDFVPRPVTPYGKTKLMAEQYIQKHCPPDKQYVILRPTMIHGPGNKGNLNLLYNLVKMGLPYPFGKINNKRSFTSIENISFVIREILSNPIESGIYHIADDEPTFTHQLLQMIGDQTGKPPKIWNVPISLLKGIVYLSKYMPLPLDESRYKKLTVDFVVSNEKLITALNKPLPQSNIEGLIKTLKHIDP